MMNPLGAMRRQPLGRREINGGAGNTDLCRLAYQVFLAFLFVLLACIVLSNLGTRFTGKSEPASEATRPAEPALTEATAFNLDFISHGITGFFAAIGNFFHRIVTSFFGVLSAFRYLNPLSWPGMLSALLCGCPESKGVTLDFGRVGNATVRPIDVIIPKHSTTPAAREWLETNKNWTESDFNPELNNIIRQNMIPPESSIYEGFDFKKLAGEKSDAKDLTLHGPSLIKEVLENLRDFAASRLNIIKIKNYTDTFNFNYKNALENSEKCKQDISVKGREIIALLNSDTTRNQEKNSKESDLIQVNKEITDLENEISQLQGKGNPRNTEREELDRQIAGLTTTLEKEKYNE